MATVRVRECGNGNICECCDSNCLICVWPYDVPDDQYQHGERRQPNDDPSCDRHFVSATVLALSALHRICLNNRFTSSSRTFRSREPRSLLSAWIWRAAISSRLIALSSAKNASISSMKRWAMSAVISGGLRIAMRSIPSSAPWSLRISAPRLPQRVQDTAAAHLSEG
jgi:hypothetical protein